MKHPKIYTDCYQTAIQVFFRTKSFPKALRPILGRKIEEAILLCLLSIYKASVNKKRLRIDHLSTAQEALDELRTLIQFSKDLKAINLAGFSELSNLTKEIGREIGGFLKHEKSNTP